MFRTKGSLPPGEMTCRPCRAAGRGVGKGLIGAVRVCELPTCGREFVQKHRNRAGAQRFCSVTCRNDSVKLRWAYRPKRAKPSKDAHTRRRRELLRLARRGESPVLAVVAERSGFRCHLCGERVDMAEVAFTRWAPEMDHVVPVRMGGAHGYANVRLAHRYCNLRKGRRLVSVAEWVGVEEMWAPWAWELIVAGHDELVFSG